MLIDKIKEIDERIWYAKKCIVSGWTFVVFDYQIDLKLNETDNPTIGLLLCKNKDKISVEWALKAANVPVGVASYEVKNYLPTEEEINSLL